MLLSRGFHELREGDNVESPSSAGFWGSVHTAANGSLLIQWPNGGVGDADWFMKVAKYFNEPYRVER